MAAGAFEVEIWVFIVVVMLLVNYIIVIEDYTWEF